MHTPLVFFTKLKPALLPVLFVFISVCLGCVFLFSAYTKLFPIEYFEYQLVGSHLVSWAFAPFVSRLLIGFEFFVGTCLLTTIDYKKTILKAVTVVITIFSIYIIYRLFAFGNEANCSCFGDVVQFSNLASLGKNIIILVLLFVLLKFQTCWYFRYSKVLIILLGMIGLSAVFIINPINKEYVVSSNLAEVNYSLDFDFLYQNPSYQKPSVDVRRGKHIVAFLSITCPHCKLAALKLGIMMKNNPTLPIYFILNGDSNNLKKFYAYTNAQQVPSSIVLGKRFSNLSGFSLPAIVWLENSKVVKKSQYVDIAERDILNWANAKP